MIDFDNLTEEELEEQVVGMLHSIQNKLDTKDALIAKYSDTYGELDKDWKCMIAHVTYELTWRDHLIAQYKDTYGELE